MWRLARHNHQERTNVHSYTNPLTLCSFPLGKARMGLSSGNSVGVALSRRRYRSRNISGTAANITIINSKQGDTKIQKAVVTAVGFAWVCLSVTPVGKRVFLRVVPTIPTVMHGMTTAATTVKNAALGRSKSPPGQVMIVHNLHFSFQHLRISCVCQCSFCCKQGSTKSRYITFCIYVNLTLADNTLVHRNFES